MLSAEEKERIRQEEQYRLAVQEEIKKVAEKAKPTSPLGRLVASDNVRWIATSIAVPLAVGLWGLFSTYIADKQHAAQAKEAAAQRQQELSIATGQRNVELVIELLPAFSEPPGTLARLHAIAAMQTLEKFRNGRRTSRNPRCHARPVSVARVQPSSEFCWSFGASERTAVGSRSQLKAGRWGRSSE